MIFIPEVNPHSFVFFFEKGESGLAWSIYDYSAPGPPHRRYDRSDFPWTAQQIRDKALHSFDAPTVATTEYAFWHEHTLALNKTHLAAAPAEVVKRPEPAGRIDEFLRRSQDVFTNKELAQRASLHKRKIDGGGVGPSTITRIRKNQPVSRVNREAIASVINTVIPCTAEDLLPPRENE